MPLLTPLSLAERHYGLPSTLRKLDVGLQWQEGSATRALEGGDPTPVTTPARFDITAFHARAKANPYPESARALEEALADAERRRLEEDAQRAGSSRVRRWLEIRRKPEQDRTDEERAFLQQRIDERNRLAELAQRSAAEAPLIDLVVDGHTLAEVKNDVDVSAYVRQVESVVVGFLGIDRVTDALDGRTMERTIRRAVEAGLLEPFMDELDRLKAAGIDGRERLRRLALSVDELVHQQEEANVRAHPSSNAPESDAPTEAVEIEEVTDEEPARQPTADHDPPSGDGPPPIDRARVGQRMRPKARKST